MKKTFALMMLVAVLTACTVAWGASYHVVAASPEMVRYEYELATVSEESMQKAAQKHCQQFQKDAVFQGREEGGYEYMSTYRCVAADPLWQ